MKICLNWNIIVCGLFCVFPVDIIGQSCQCKPRWSADECRSCDVGCYYSSGGWCLKCSSNCYSCQNAQVCDECKPGYYGQRCEHDCKTTCRYGSCTNKVCTNGCADGYYYFQYNSYDSSGYCRQCLNTCVTCNSYYECTACIAEHTGSYCQNCKDGYYRNNWQCIQCNKKCLQGKCNKRTGKCTDGCYNGWSGWTCNDVCASNCISCDRENIATCNYCPIGHYGSLCNNTCSSTCVALHGVRKCSERNGDCNYGCVDGWTGSKCTDKCDMNCLSCETQNKNVCRTCSPGLYGQLCKNECSSNCVQTLDIRQCHQQDCQCSFGCVEGWTGSTCTEQCAENCTSCAREDGTACTSCKPGQYGPSCNIECGAHCGDIIDVNRQCHQDDGICLGDCVMGYQGDKCDVPCHAGCRSGCYRDTGFCEPCKPAYFGTSCQHLCNTTCYDPVNDSNVCHQLSGECLFNCPKHVCSLNGLIKDVKTSVYVAVVGGAVGSAVMIVLVVATVLVFMFHRKKRINMSDPERRITYDNHKHIEDEKIDDNVYSVPDKKRRVKENIGETQSAAHSILLKLPSNEPVTTGDVVYSNVECVPVIPSQLGAYEPEDNVEELCEDEASGSVKAHNTTRTKSLEPVVPNIEAHHTTFTPSNRQVTKGEAHYTALTPAPVGPVYEQFDTNVDVECGDIQAHYMALTPSQQPVYEELNKNDDVEYGNTKDYEVPTTSNYYNI